MINPNLSQRRHTGECRYPVNTLYMLGEETNWTPACAGVTEV